MRKPAIGLTLVGLLAWSSAVHAEDKAGWAPLFNGKDTTGWKLRARQVTLTKFVDADGKVIPGAKAAKLDTKDMVVDGKNRPIPGAKVDKVNGKDVPVDAEGKVIGGAKIIKIGGRNAIVGADGKEIVGAKQVNETVDNSSGWDAENGELICARPHGGNDLLTEQTFTDFELHIEFQATSNSGVYLQGRYEIQVNNDFGAKPKIVEIDGKKVEQLDSHQCGAIYGLIAPSKNMAKQPKEWQSFDVLFRAPRGQDGKVTQKARVTLIWNGEKVIDDAEIAGPTGAALDGKVLEPGPLLLQGDHGRVAYRNIRVRTLQK